MNKYNPLKHNRRSIRLKGYDYAQAGRYFVTLCVQDRRHLFGKIEHEEMQLNLYGTIVAEEWEKTPKIRKNISLGAYIVMPNHFHGIIHIDYQITSPQNQPGKFQSPANSISAIIRGFKGATTKKIKEIIRSSSTGELQFAPTGSIWQRDYWEHIIRDENAYLKISQYIKNNPKKWANDKLNGGKGNTVLDPASPYGEEDWMV